MFKSFDEVKAAVQYFKELGVVKFSVGDISVDFGPAPIVIPTGAPGLLDDPEAMQESNLEFIKTTLAQAAKEADEIEHWSSM